MWSASDVRGTAASVAPWWELLTAGVPAGVVAALRTPDVEAFLSGGPGSPGSTGSPGVERVEAVKAALLALSAAGRALAAAGYGMAPHTGRVAGLFIGDGGVPKAPVAAVRVGTDGLAGDRQRTRKHHGRVWQALCLWSAEVVDTLAAQGHPVFPGACGENVLVAGVDWTAVRPGARLRIGSALAEISVPTIPCKQIRPFFSGGAIRRVHHDRHPGSSRWYATVIEAGKVAVGDAVLVEPRSRD